MTHGALPHCSTFSCVLHAPKQNCHKCDLRECQSQPSTQDLVSSPGMGIARPLCRQEMAAQTMRPLGVPPAPSQVPTPPPLLDGVGPCEYRSVCGTSESQKLEDQEAPLP